jgi:hypothetical protein
MVKFECPERGSLALTSEPAGAAVSCPWCDSRLTVRGQTPFTEDDWQTHSHVFLLLQFARRHASDRKLWLFCYACARRILGRVEGAVDQAERRVGQRSGWKKKAHSAAWLLQVVPRFLNGGSEREEYVGELQIDQLASAVWGPGSGHPDEGDVIEQAGLLRDIVGNPFRPAAIRPEVLAWDGGRVSKLGQPIYDERRFDDLPILADALEDAGCTDQGILDHLRSPGPHVRGCWVVDLLTERK